MKKVAILLALFCMLTVTASAAYIPEDVISENRDGRQLIVKTYMLPPDADPSGLVEEPFEVEGYSYHHLETVKEEQTFEDSKIQTEVVTLETDVDDLAAILEHHTDTGKHLGHSILLIPKADHLEIGNMFFQLICLIPCYYYDRGNSRPL